MTVDAVKPMNGSLSWRAGAEASLGASFALRAGYDLSPGRRAGASMGLGFATAAGAPSSGVVSQWGQFRVDYAYSFKQGVEAAQQLSVGVEFQ